MRLTLDRRMMLEGYYQLLECCPDHSGAYIHKAKQFSTVIRLKLELDRDISPEYEVRIKMLISFMYRGLEERHQQ